MSSVKKKDIYTKIISKAEKSSITAEYLYTTEKGTTFLWNNKYYNKFYIIRNVDVHAGFCALMIYALNGIRKSESLNAIPVIDFNKYNTSNFYDKLLGESIWNYFFEAISPYTQVDIQSFLTKGLISRSSIYIPSSEEIMLGHHHEKERIATFWAQDRPIDKGKWMNQKRNLGRLYIKKHIRVNPTICAKVKKFVNTNFTNYFVVGVHIRGTDFAYATPTDAASYFEEIDRIVQVNQNSKYRIYLATDQEQYLTLFKSYYCERLLYIDALRSSNHIAPFRMEHSSAYKKGEDVLMDMLLLSKCNHVIKGASAVGELALWFNSRMAITDFALRSEFYQKPYHKLETVYTFLNVGKKTPMWLAVHRLKAQGIRRMQTFTIGFELYKRFKFFRKILRH